MTKALVLSGGGPVGIAWQIGLAAGLARGGVDLTTADFIIGTSAGSAVGAQLALGQDMEANRRRYVEATASGVPITATGAARGQSMAERMAKLFEIMSTSAGSDATPEATRAAIGRFALEAETIPEETFVGFFSYLHDQGWPRRYCCTAVDAESGEFVVWDGSVGEPLDRAVASSCAVPGIFPPITIEGRRYIDGGMRSGTSVDLAAGHDRVLVVTLLGAARAGAAADDRFAEFARRAEAEEAVVTDAGGEVRVVAPGPAFFDQVGLNLMDGSLSPVAAEIGVEEGETLAAELAAFWA